MNQLFTSLTNEFDSLENVRNMEDWNQLKAFNKWRHKNSSRIDDDDCKAEVVRVKERVSDLIFIP